MSFKENPKRVIGAFTAFSTVIVFIIFLCVFMVMSHDVHKQIEEEAPRTRLDYGLHARNYFGDTDIDDDAEGEEEEVVTPLGVAVEAGGVSRLVVAHYIYDSLSEACTHGKQEQTETGKQKKTETGKQKKTETGKQKKTEKGQVVRASHPIDWVISVTISVVVLLVGTLVTIELFEPEEPLKGTNLALFAAQFCEIIGASTLCSIAIASNVKVHRIKEEREKLRGRKTLEVAFDRGKKIVTTETVGDGSEYCS